MGAEDAREAQASSSLLQIGRKTVSTCFLYRPSSPESHQGKRPHKHKEHRVRTARATTLTRPVSDASPSRDTPRAVRAARSARACSVRCTRAAPCCRSASTASGTAPARTIATCWAAGERCESARRSSWMGRAAAALSLLCLAGLVVRAAANRSISQGCRLGQGAWAVQRERRRTKLKNVGAENSPYV